MLTSADLERIPIDEDVLNLLPEAVAREHCALPFRYGPGTLHVILAHDLHGSIEETLQALQLTVDRRITYDTAERDALGIVVDIHYSARGSVVQNCPRRFLFRCSKRWVDLPRTADDHVRHCDACDTNVRLCKADVEINAATARKECVAYYESSEAFLGIICDGQ